MPAANLLAVAAAMHIALLISNASDAILSRLLLVAIVPHVKPVAVPAELHNDLIVSNAMEAILLRQLL